MQFALMQKNNTDTNRVQTTNYKMLWIRIFGRSKWIEPKMRNSMLFANTAACLGRRLFSCTARTSTHYDPKMFVEPIVDMQELNKPLEAHDKRRYMHPKAMLSDQSPVFYRNPLIDKLIHVFMLKGKKELCRQNVLDALEIIKRRQYRKWFDAQDEKERAKIELDPIVLTQRALLNCRPLMALRPITRGGILYKMPIPLDERESVFQAMKMMRDICRQKSTHKRTDKRSARGKHFRDSFAGEILAAAQNEGMTIHAKQELHKVCEQNRSVAVTMNRVL